MVEKQYTVGWKWTWNSEFHGNKLRDTWYNVLKLNRWQLWNLSNNSKISMSLTGYFIGTSNDKDWIFKATMKIQQHGKIQETEFVILTPTGFLICLRNFGCKWRYCWYTFHKCQGLYSVFCSVQESIPTMSDLI